MVKSLQRFLDVGLLLGPVLDFASVGDAVGTHVFHLWSMMIAVEVGMWT